MNNFSKWEKIPIKHVEHVGDEKHDKLFGESSAEPVKLPGTMVDELENETENFENGTGGDSEKVLPDRWAGVS